jgi:hypothetical protein
MKFGNSGRLKISAVQLGERRRVKMGSIAALAKSMDTYGLIHPIVVRDDGMLVAGGRRLEAAKKLGWKSIPATPISKLSDEQLREIELEENIRREGLDSYEASAQRMKEIRVIEDKLRHDDAVSPGGRGRKGGNREVASRLGVGEATVRRTKKHVGMVDRFPSMAHKDWNQGLVLAAEEYMAALVPEAEGVFKEELSGHRVRPAETLAAMTNLAAKPRSEQKKIAKLCLSESDDERFIGASRLHNIPPALPAWVSIASEIRVKCEQAEKRAGSSGMPKGAKRFFKDVIHAAQLLDRMAKTEYQKIKKAEGF